LTRLSSHLVEITFFIRYAAVGPPASQ